MYILLVQNAGTVRLTLQARSNSCRRLFQAPWEERGRAAIDSISASTSMRLGPAAVNRDKRRFKSVLPSATAPPVAPPPTPPLSPPPPAWRRDCPWEAKRRGREGHRFDLPLYVLISVVGSTIPTLPHACRSKRVNK